MAENVNVILPYQFEPLRRERRQLRRLSDSEDSGEESDSEANVHRNRVGNHDWCLCGMCRDMDTIEESKCCQEYEKVQLKAEEEQVPCICEHSMFEVNFLDYRVLRLAVLEYYDIEGPPDGNLPSHELYRLVAYKRFVRWIWRRLRKKKRKVLPSCVVSRIRDKFQSEQVTGFKYALDT